MHDPIPTDDPSRPVRGFLNATPISAALWAAFLGFVLALGLCAKQAEGATIDTLYRVNHHVNATVRYVEDRPGMDVWRRAVTHGDCEDYAIAKMELLAAAGVPRDRMQIVVFRLDARRDLWHAVLKVTAPDGSDYILDNLTNRVRPSPWRRGFFRFAKQGYRAVMPIEHAAILFDRRRAQRALRQARVVRTGGAPTPSGVQASGAFDSAACDSLKR